MRKPCFAALALFPLLLASALRADWQKTDTTLAWTKDGKVVWSFTFDPGRGKVFFEPLTVNGGPSLTAFRPVDHPHHYALWFSWKYINHTNYWEESIGPGVSAGKTSWTAPVIETKPDGGARIRLGLTYSDRATGRVDLVEQREVDVSAPAADGAYTIDWKAKFMAAFDGALLDRTPMPGEPKGAFNGGYAGFSIRMASDPLALTYLSSDSVITDWPQSRSRPNAPAVAANFAADGKDVGAVAILSDPKNAGEKAPWYLINQKDMKFMCAAILAPKPREVKAGEQFELNYRVALSPKAWTPETLKAAHQDWVRGSR